VRLQHGGGKALYRDSLQAAAIGPFLSVFRKIRQLIAQRPDLAGTITNIWLRLTDLVATTIRAASSAAIRVKKGWDYQSVEKEYGCCEDK
jgi:hypothetical protein